MQSASKREMARIGASAARFTVTNAKLCTFGGSRGQQSLIGTTVRCIYRSLRLAGRSSKESLPDGYFLGVFKIRMMTIIPPNCALGRNML